MSYVEEIAAYDHAAKVGPPVAEAGPAPYICPIPGLTYHEWTPTQWTENRHAGPTSAQVHTIQRTVTAWRCRFCLTARGEQ